MRMRMIEMGGRTRIDFRPAIRDAYGVESDERTEGEGEGEGEGEESLGQVVSLAADLPRFGPMVGMSMWRACVPVADRLQVLREAGADERAIENERGFG